MIIHNRYDAGMSKRDGYGSLGLRKLKTRRHHTPTPSYFFVQILLITTGFFTVAYNVLQLGEPKHSTFPPIG